MDPDGREIDFSICSKKNWRQLLNVINEASVIQFELTETGKLCIDNSRFNREGSPYYSISLLKAIISDYTIYISFRSLLPKEWVIEDGVDPQVKAGRNFVFHNTKRAYIFISPSNWTYIDIYGNLHETSHGEVLFHEISGHVIPKLENLNGNAIDIENIIRGQLHLPLRMGDSEHVCF